MRRILLKVALGLGVAIALLAAWVAGGRALAFTLDHFHLVPIESRPITALGLDEAERGIWRLNDFAMSTAGTDDRPFPMETKIDPGREFVVQTPQHAIVLGRVEESSLGKVVRPGPGDRARLQVERGLSWPTPLAINFLSGHSPSWKRHLYYRLVWEKPDGGRLEMLWRYEQYFYEDWASGFMTRAGATGLIRVEIRP